MYFIHYKEIVFCCLLLITNVLVKSLICESHPTEKKFTHPVNKRDLGQFNQLTSLPECPENFIDAVNICYYITPLTTFPPLCPFENVLPFNSYKDIISTNGQPIWMPVRRDLSNGLGVVEWTEASTLYKKEFTVDFEIVGKIKGKDCLVYYNNTKIVLVSCDEKFSGVCAYYKLNEVSDVTCESSETCTPKDFSVRSSCVCLGGSDKDQSIYTKAEFLKPYQNTVYKSLTSDDCTIGLQRTENGTYIWTNSQTDPDYWYWKPNTNFDSTYIYGAITSEGWTLTEEPLPCFLFETNFVETPEPNLSLSFENEESLRLTISNPKSLKLVETGPLVYCFSDVGTLSLTYRYEYLTKISESEDALVYEFTPHKNGPGNYWCEAFTSVSSQSIKSERLFVKQSKLYGDDFVAILNTQYISGSNPLSFRLIELFERIFFLKVNLTTTVETGCTYSSRFMKIIDLDEENFTALVNVHLTCLISQKLSTDLPIPSYTDQEFNRIKTLIAETVISLQDIDAEMVDFRSASYCPAVYQILHWPRTNIGDDAISEEYCFLSNGMRLTHRTCGGEFYGGAQWEEIKNCTKPSHSSITELLLDIFQNPAQLVGIYNISLDYTKFDSFDVYLVALLLNTYWENINPSEFAGILENIFKINNSIIAEAQDQMRATDIILDTIDNMAAFTDFNGDNFYIISDNNSSGIVLFNNGSIKPLMGDNSISDVIEIYPDLEGALLSSSTKTFKSAENIAFKVFYTNVFFTGSQGVKKTTRSVFGVTSPASSAASVQLIYRKSAESNTVGDCVYWSYDLKAEDGRGFWKIANQSKDLESFVLCDFSDVNVAAVTLLYTRKNSQNVTEDLKQLLESEEDPQSILNDLSLISDRYDEFTSDDVYLVGRILEQISKNTELDLSALGHLVSNLHEIQRDILLNSQKQKLATDLILYAVDTILNNHNFSKTVNVTENNFLIYIADVKESNFTGLVVFDNNLMLQTTTLTGNIEMDDIFNVKNLNSALYLPSELKEQMPNDTKIIVTIFFNDGLFNDDAAFKFISKIFGVILPLGTLLEPLSFIHKVVEEHYDRSCVYWSYDKSSNITGWWKKDHYGSKTSSTFSQCKFWHTTHFALLLVDTNRYDSLLLDWITNISCGLSMFGLCSIILTAVFFRRWRTNCGNQILLNYVFASILQIGVFYTSTVINQNSDDSFLCTIIGIVLHYSIISQFCWMFVIAVLQFKRFVEVLKGPPKHVLLKACLCGWGLPCLPVVCVYFLDNENYTKGNVSLCYPSGLGLFLGVWLPVGIIVIINFVIFIYIIYNVVHRKTECHDVGNNEVMFQWRLAILLFFMLGITWTFGFLSELDFGILFVYVFCITATLQGFVMFLFFIVFNANTRYMYVHACNKNNKHY